MEGAARIHHYDITVLRSQTPERSIAELERLSRRCVELAPEDAGCQISLGLLYRVTKQPGKQIAAFERAVRASPSSPFARFWLGLILALAGDPEGAISQLEIAMRLSPRESDLVYMCEVGMGWAHFGAGRYAAAVEWGRRSVKHSPERAFAYRTLASAYGRLGQLDKARAALREELRLDPGLTIANVRRENPTTDPDFLERWLDGLRKAGLPEE
jgi:adenylate cyclase